MDIDAPGPSDGDASHQDRDYAGAASLTNLTAAGSLTTLTAGTGLLVGRDDGFLVDETNVDLETYITNYSGAFPLASPKLSQPQNPAPSCASKRAGWGCAGCSVLLHGHAAL
jgi:hypothetical protein